MIEELHIREGKRDSNEPLPSATTLELFKRADVIFCCPDRFARRVAAAREGAGKP